MADNGFEVFNGQRNARVVKLLRDNPDVSGTIQALLEHMVEWADEHGCEFKDIRLIEPHVSPDGRYIKAHLTKVS